MSAQPTSINFREVPRLTAGSALAAIREQIKPNFLDRLIATISPGRGVQRMKSKAMLAMGGWSGLGGFMGGRWLRSSQAK